MNNYAIALSTIANTRNLSLRKILNPAEFLSLQNALAALRFPAYTVWAARFNGAKSATPVQVDMGALYAAAKTLCALIGEVNGAGLHAENLVELIVAASHKVRKIDITEEMANLRYRYAKAKKAAEENPSDAAQMECDRLREECKLMENTPGNCKDSHEPVTESTFVTAVARMLGAIIDDQQAKSAEQVAAEEAERKAKLQAAAKARKAAKAKAAAK